MAVFELGTTDSNLILNTKLAMSHLETRCSCPDSCAFSEPVSKFGWTFCKIAIRSSLIDGIEKEFAGMISQYRDKKPEDRLARFLSDYLESKNCPVRLKLLEY